MKRLSKLGFVGVSAAMLFSSVPVAGAMTPMGESIPMNGPAVMGKAEAMMGSGSTEAPVDTKITREKAIELAKQYVEVPSDYTLQGVSYQNMQLLSGQTGAWNIQFTKQDQRRHYGSVSVSIDSDTGKLNSFYSYQDEGDKAVSYPPKVDLEKAKQIALDSVAKLSPELKDQLQYYDAKDYPTRQPLTGRIEHSIKFVRVVNGVVFPQNFIMISVNGDGKVLSYNKQWDPAILFKNVEKPISQQQAEEAFQTKSDLELVYVLPGNGFGKADPLLTYRMKPFLLDAEKGDILTLDGRKQNPDAKWVPVSEQPLKEEVKEGLKLTKEQAVERVQSLIGVPKDAKLEDASYRENVDPWTGKSSVQWELRWSLAEDGSDQGGRNLHATVDSNTGAILQYSKYDYRIMASDSKQEGKNKLSYDQLKEKAIQHMKTLLPAYAHELFLEPAPEQDALQEKIAYTDGYAFNFKRIVGGVNTEYDSAHLRLDLQTGEIKQFYSNIMRIDYPSSQPKVITSAEATAKLLDQYHVELQYMMNSYIDGGQPIPMEKYNLLVASGVVKPSENGKKQEARLVYQLVPKYQFLQPAVLDAQTGEWKNREDRSVVKPPSAPPADIKGHWAEAALSLMIDYQALDVEDGMVKPDEGITRGEMVKMLLAAVNGGYPYFPMAMYAERTASFSDVAKDNKYFAYIENAIDRGLIDRTSGEFKPDEVLTRSELASLLVRALGYQKLAQIEGMFASEASDLDGIKNPGEIALITKLSIMSLDNGQFKPAGQVTRAQAATAFFSFLQVRSQLQDKPNAMY
ncbi:S-layer homology domain-containing protein [Paenibacillus sp. GD4]|uniref:S-layer homology domain-containing protein n=1 Tax=Paenibacillus sp. GD4 TaxID=3068890 RepID=UPI002796C0A9|nr:S-layer homology domain-containing protein [Paenibacillus sp. GD4]MDQ1909165.1 S-layer homology domain-containing protein [Paenibacillus sp. GD4]